MVTWSNESEIVKIVQYWIHEELKNYKKIILRFLEIASEVKKTFIPRNRLDPAHQTFANFRGAVASCFREFGMLKIFNFAFYISASISKSETYF